MALQDPEDVPGESWFTITAARMFEHRISKLLETGMDNFVLAAEAGRVDCSLVTGAPFVCQPGRDQVDVARLEKALNEKRRVVPLEFKTFGPLRRANYPQLSYYCVNPTAYQREQCAANILQNAAASDWIAVIPASLALESPVPRYEDGMPAFPVRWLPFVMPPRTLCLALKKFQQFCEGQREA
jgi:hypothetical protein